MCSVKYETDNDFTMLRNYTDILKYQINDEGCKTTSSTEQKKVEKNVLLLYKLNKEPILDRYKHIEFLKKSLIYLTTPYECLDSSRPWLCYWILHSLQILNERLEDKIYSNIVKFLSKCQSRNGGFGGGPGQLPHLATTYAAVNALYIIGTKEAYEAINRAALVRFLISLHAEDGSFSMHYDGEADIRGAYCALSVAKLTNTFSPEIFKDTARWIQRCQTWEGGFGGCPGMEAHGGYALCGLASLVLLGETNLCNLKSLIRWAVNKQMILEGGFQGRTNKLVDGCYSFWHGGIFPTIHAILLKQNPTLNMKHWLFNQHALQEYLLICCQDSDGGLLDKPEKSRDVYHTCYALSGLSVAQNSECPLITGPQDINSVKPIHSVYNLELSTVMNGLAYFKLLPDPVNNKIV